MILLYVMTVASLGYAWIGQLAFFFGLMCNFDSIFMEGETEWLAFYDPN